MRSCGGGAGGSFGALAWRAPFAAFLCDAPIPAFPACLPVVFERVLGFAPWLFRTCIWMGCICVPCIGTRVTSPNPKAAVWLTRDKSRQEASQLLQLVANPPID